MFKFLIILSLYFGLIYWISYRKKGDHVNYYQINEKIPVIVLAFSIFATLLSPISFLTLINNSYTGNLYLWFAQCGIFIAIPLAHQYFLPLYLKRNYTTAYHILEDKFQSNIIRSIASSLFIIYQLGKISVITYLLSQALQTFISINQIILSGLILLFTVYYLTKGGLLIVIWTDFLQGLILIAILALFIPKIINSESITNQYNNLSQIIEKIDLNSIILLIIGSGLSTLFTYVSSQDIVQRFNSKINTNKIIKTLWLQGFLSLGIASLLYLIGLLIRNQNFVNTSTNSILMTYTKEKLSTLFSGLLMVALLAAGQSTISSSINAIVTCLKFDFTYLKIKLSPSKTSFIITLISWIICIILMNSQIYSIYQWINGFMGMTLGVIGGLYIIILIIKKPTVKIANIYLILTLSSLIIYNYSNLISNPNPWLNSIIASTFAISISIVIKLSKIPSNRKKHRSICQNFKPN